MNLPYKTLEEIETKATEVRNLFKTMLTEEMIKLYDLDSYDLETCRVLIDKMSLIINEANWSRYQSKDFVRTQTKKLCKEETA